MVSIEHVYFVSENQQHCKAYIVESTSHLTGGSCQLYRFTRIYALSGLRHGIGQHVGAILLDSHFIEGAGHSENLGRGEYAKINALCRQYCHSPILQKEKTPHHDIITTTIAPPPHKEDSAPV